MMVEQISLIFTCYIYGLLILIPIFIIYWLVDYRSASISTTLRLHKHCLLATIYLPFVIYFNSLIETSSLENHVLASIVAVTNSEASDPVLNTDQVIQPVVPNLRYEAQNAALTSGNVTTADYYPTMQDFVYFFSRLLFICSCIGFIYFIYRYLLQNRYLYVLEKNSAVSFIANDISLFRSSLITSSFSTGIFKKRIFIPSNISEDKKNIIVEHELTHFSCRHHFWSLIETIMVFLFWFNPFVHFLKKRGALYREIECDSIVTESVDKFDYSRTLVESAESLLPKKQNGLIIQNWVDKKNLKNRIDYILGGKRSPRRTFFSIVFASGIVASTFIFFKIENVNDDFLESEVLSTIQQDHEQVLKLRERIEFNKVPEDLILSLLVHEDKAFYQHDGLSYSGIARAITANLQSFLSETEMFYQGGSTITQQLAKSFLKAEKSLDRKIREFKVTRVLEKNFSKNQILEMYLNRVYFGNRAWGLNHAAITYFDKSYTQLSRNESAMLIPFLAAPTKYNLIDNPSLAQQRQSQLLQRMDEI